MVAWSHLGYQRGFRLFHLHSGMIEVPKSYKTSDIHRSWLFLSNIEVRGNAKSEDFDLPESFVAFSRVVAG